MLTLQPMTPNEIRADMRYTLEEIRAAQFARAARTLKTAEETLESMIRCEASKVSLSIAQRAVTRAKARLVEITHGNDGDA